MTTTYLKALAAERLAERAETLRDDLAGQVGSEMASDLFVLLDAWARGLHRKADAERRADDLDEMTGRQLIDAVQQMSDADLEAVMTARTERCGQMLGFS